jgi:hypothetical protein
MHQHNSQHVVTQIRIEWQRLSDEVIQSRYRFHTGEAAARDYESK